MIAALRGFQNRITMPIFISYSSKDQKAAEAICAAIENRGHPCWISSRDIGPGENFQTQIVRAIRHARIMVLVFSSNANNSEEIKKELVLAGQSRLVVIPVRVEDVTPDEAFAYEFATRQWIDVFGDWEHAIQRVVHQIEAVIGEEEAATPKPAEDKPAPSPAPPPPAAPPAAAPSTQAAPPPAPRKLPMAAILGGAAVITVILAGLLAWQIWPRIGTPPSATAPVGPVATNPSSGPAPSGASTPITIPPTAPGAPQPGTAANDPLIASLTSIAPMMSEQVRGDHAHAYREAMLHKAMAVAPDSTNIWVTVGRPSADGARDAVLELCEISAGKPCALVAVDDTPQPIPPDGKWQGEDMPQVHYAGEFDLAQMPGLTPELREGADFAGYHGLAGPKAIAFHLAGAARYFIGSGANQHAAEVDALKRCDNDERGAQADLHECFLYASGNSVVFPRRSRDPVTAQPTAASQAPPKTFRDCPNCPEMVVIPAGSFQMGAGPGENERFEVPMVEAGRDEPRHKVTFARPFALGKFDVTRGEFVAFAEATGFSSRPGCQTVMGNQWVPMPQANWEHPGYPQTELDPVVCMNDIEIGAYLDWLRQKTGKDYRLPSEAEWEYAERGGTTTAFYWGDDPNDACAYENVGDENYGTKYGVSNPILCSDGFADLAPVGSFKPNPFGLYDMAGNIFVMTADCWNENYAGAPADGARWTSGECTRHVVRKAAFGNPHAWMFRSANRGAEGDRVRRNRFGFRVALSLP
jgi:formylglycine-generating enzyme required for sulfatase activity